MKFFSVLFTCGALAFSPAVAMAQAPIYIEAEDGRFLGFVNSNRYDRDSICNRYGEYGSPYSQGGIFSSRGPYGVNAYNGAYDPNAIKPPKLKIGNRTVRRITVNTRIRNAYDPDVLLREACG